LENVGQEFGHEMRLLVLYRKTASFVAPTLDASVTTQHELKWRKDYDLYIQKKTKYDDEGQSICLVLSCCNEPMKNKVEEHPKYAQMEEE
jgi:hypothetical protein